MHLIQQGLVPFSFKHWYEELSSCTLTQYSVLIVPTLFKSKHKHTFTAWLTTHLACHLHLSPSDVTGNPSIALAIGGEVWTRPCALAMQLDTLKKLHQASISFSLPPFHHKHLISLFKLPGQLACPLPHVCTHIVFALYSFAKNETVVWKVTSQKSYKERVVIWENPSDVPCGGNLT